VSKTKTAAEDQPARRTPVQVFFRLAIAKPGTFDRTEEQVTAEEWDIVPEVDDVLGHGVRVRPKKTGSPARWAFVPSGNIRCIDYEEVQPKKGKAE
jgi:hypothetical protein